MEPFYHFCVVQWYFGIMRQRGIKETLRFFFFKKMDKLKGEMMYLRGLICV